MISTRDQSIMRSRARDVNLAPSTLQEEILSAYVLLLLDEVERLQEALERERRGRDDDRRTWETSGEDR